MSTRPLTVNLSDLDDTLTVGLDELEPSRQRLTLDSLYAPPTQPSLTQRAANVNRPVRLAPPAFDLTQVPINLFTGTPQAPGIATEEERQRAGVIRAPGKVRVPGPHGATVEIPEDTGSGLLRALGSGAPEGSVMANLTGQRGTRNPDQMRLFAPEQLMTEQQQSRHPILTGAGQFAGGMTSPESLTLLGLTAGAGSLAGPGAQTVKQLLAAGFTAQMLTSAAQQVPEINEAIRRGDMYDAQRLLTQAVLTAATAGLAGRGMLEEPKPLYAGAESPVGEPPGLVPRREPPPERGIMPDSGARSLFGASEPPPRQVVSRRPIEAPLEALEPSRVASDYLTQLGRAHESPDVEPVNEPQPRGLTPEGAGLSNEELARNERFYKVDGTTTYLGKQPDATLRKGEAVVGVNPEGRMRVVDSRTHMSDIETINKAQAKLADTTMPAREPITARIPPEEPVAPEPQRGQTTMYSGIDPTLIKRLLPDDVITPKLQEQGIVREKTGELARAKEQTFQRYADVAKSFQKRPVQEGYDFILREQHGEKQPNAADQAVADDLQQEFAKRREKIENLSHGSFDHWQEHYFPQLWERPNQVAEAVKRNILGTKRPLQGGAGFKKARVFDDLQAGLDAGYKPVTHNPVTMGLLKLHEMDRYIMAHEILGQSRSEGLAKFVKFGERPPDGWTRVNDNMFKVMSPAKSGEGLVVRGEWYMPQEAATVLNNHLSPGLRGNTVYDALRAAGNTLNQAQLGLSAFHLGFTSVDTMVSDLALGIERASRREFKGALKAAVRTPIAPITTAIRGNRLLKEYLSPGRYADMTHLADAVADAGGRVAIDPIYKNNAIQSFMNAFRGREYGKAGLKSFSAAMELMAKPVMEYIVPRQKLGVFAGLAEDVLRRADAEGWSPERRRLELNRAWDSVDNRMGQLVYDNLFWNKAVKDLALVSVRSVGWNVGTLREVGGGIADVARIPTRGITHRTAYVLALPIVVGTLGAVMTYLATGKPPQTAKDYFFPRTGKTDAEGNPERVALPSYIKDIYAYGHDPKQVAIHKIHPLLSALAMMLQNKDFYGVEIRHVDDPLVRQVGQLMAFAAKQFVPFSGRNIAQREQASGRSDFSGFARELFTPAGIESMVGVTPAPKYITRTPAENRAMELSLLRRPPGTRTSEQFEASQRKSSLRGELAAGRMTPEQLAQRVRAGELSAKDAGNIMKQAHEATVVRAARGLSLDDFLSVWDRADERERAQLRPLLAAKRRLVGNLPPAERRAMLDRVNRALGITRDLLPGAAPLLTPSQQMEPYQ